MMFSNKNLIFNRMKTHIMSKTVQCQTRLRDRYKILNSNCNLNVKEICNLNKNCFRKAKRLQNLKIVYLRLKLKIGDTMSV